MMTKLFVTPDELRRDSFKLGAAVLKAGFFPDVMIVLWRGGATIGCYVHELFKYRGISPDHTALKTSKYTGDQANASVIVCEHIDDINKKLVPGSRVLIVDDIFDTGLSIEAVIKQFTVPVEIKIATVYFKPTRNQTAFNPDYFVHETDAWVVFPHELEGLTEQEVLDAFGGEIAEIVKNEK